MPSWLIAAALIILVTRIAGHAGARLGMPYVIGELLGGALLGPVLSALLSTRLYEQFFGADVRSTIADIAQIAVVVFMVEVGFRIRTSSGLPRARSGAAMAGGTLLIPGVAGLALAVLTPRSWLPASADPIAYCLVCAAVLSVTALPVLALIIADLGLEGRPEARLALSSAAASDVVAWLALGAAVALQNDDSPLRSLLAVAALTAVYAVTAAVRPVMSAAAARGDLRLSSGLVIGVALLAAGLAHSSGAHAAIVGLVAGFAIADPHKQLGDTVKHVSTGNMLILLPFFTVQLGLMFSPGAGLVSPSVLGAVALVCMLAFATKVIGALAAARVSGLPLRTGVGVGVLTGAKGLTEVLVLAVALEAGVISPLLFSIGMLMTLVNTIVVGPAWHAVQRLPGADLQAPEQMLTVGQYPERARP